MMNVLPRDERQRLNRNTLARFIITGSLAALAAAVVSLLSIAPTIILLHASRATLERSIEADEADSDLAADREAAQRTRALLTALAPMASTTRVNGPIVIREALAEKPDDLTISSIAYASEGDGFTLILTGQASREDANVYKDALLSHGRFSEVSIPVAALLGTTEDSRFSATLRGAL